MEKPIKSTEPVTTNKLFVGNISYKTQWQGLKDHFKQCGNVTFATVVTDPNSGLSKGYGRVEYETVEEAQRAVDELFDSELDGRNLTVKEDKRDSLYKVYVGNLSYSTRWQELKDHFKQCGPVALAEVMQDRDGRSRGQAVVSFNDADSMRKAIETLNNTHLQGRDITVREWSDKPKSHNQ